MKPIKSVVSVGNAILDVLYEVPETTLVEFDLQKGSMNLVDNSRAEYLHSRLNQVPEYISGGSAANTAAGLAFFGSESKFIGKVAGDEFGFKYLEEMNNLGVNWCGNVSKEGRTGTSHILVTPDSQRTMSTHLGVADKLQLSDVTADYKSDILFFELYLWDSPTAKLTIENLVMNKGDSLLALSLSDSLCVERHRSSVLNLLEKVDILFTNEQELASLFSVSLDEGIEILSAQVDVVCLTRGELGSMIILGDEVTSIPTYKYGEVIDTTGAGDLYAAGFFYGLTKGRDFITSAHYGSKAAGEVINHLGARPCNNVLADL